MKKVLSLAITMLLAASLSFAQATGGTTDTTNKGKTTATTKGKKGATTKTKKGHMGGMKGK